MVSIKSRRRTSRKSKPMDNSGRLAAGNRHIGWIFYKKKGSGYVTFKTKGAARKRGYNPSKHMRHPKR